MKFFPEKVMNYVRLMRWHRPVPLYLLLWPTLWGVWLGGRGHPSLKIVLIFLAGVVVMRSAGCVINDIADRHFDPQVTRTRDRPLASGKIAVWQALLLFGFLCALGLLLVLCLNWLSLYFAIAAVALAILYPFTKRYTYWPQLVLGLTWYLGIPMAFAAQLNTVPWCVLPLYLAAALWAVVYDTYYGMTDREDDVKIGLKSTAILFGKWDRVILGIFQGAVLILLWMSGQCFHLAYYYDVSLVVAAGFFVYQQYLIKDRNPQACLHAFLNSHYVGFAVLLGIIASLL